MVCLGELFGLFSVTEAINGIGVMIAGGIDIVVDGPLGVGGVFIGVGRVATVICGMGACVGTVNATGIGAAGIDSVGKVC